MWIDLDAMAAAQGETKKTPEALSDSHRTASVCIIHEFLCIISHLDFLYLEDLTVL